MKTILIPVDFSDHSVSTYTYAIKIVGENSKTKIHFHHSYNDQLTAPDPGLSGGFDNESFLNMQLIEEFRNQAETNMKKLEAEVLEYITKNNYSEISIETSVTGGEPDWEILSLCKELRPELIIMGTQGTGKKEIFEGSVAKRIMNKANIPVIAVPIGAHNNHDDLRIMYACNNHDKDYLKIKLLFTIFKNINVRIFGVHFHFEGSKDRNIQLIKDLEESFNNGHESEKARFFFIDSSDKDDALEFFVEKNNINTIAFISHKSNIFKYFFSEKITKNDFFKLGLPMIALHE